MTCLHNHDKILEFLRKIFLKGFQIYQNYLCALSISRCLIGAKTISVLQYQLHSSIAKYIQIIQQIHSDGFRGGAIGTPSPNFDRLCFYIPFCIRMLKNKAQIARESILFKKNLRASRALIGPWTPSTRALPSWYACMHIIFCPPPPPE